MDTTRHFNSDYAVAVAVAVACAVDCLRNKLPSDFLYHNAMHAGRDVLPASEQRFNLSKSGFHPLSDRFHKHEDRPFLDLADTSSLISIPVLPEIADQLNGSTYRFMD